MKGLNQLEENEKKEEELNKKEEKKKKKDNTNFDKNIKAIFNNIGKIDIQKPEKEKEIDKDKENNEYELKIYKKDEQSIRKLYYSQLLLKKVWKPINDSKRHNSLIWNTNTKTNYNYSYNYWHN